MAQVYFYTILDPFESDNTSGGPQAYKNIIKNIEYCGYNVEVITPKNPFKDPNTSSFNVYQDIFNDPFGSPWFEPHQYDQLLNAKPQFIVSECAYTCCTTAPYGDLSQPGTDLTPTSRPFFERAKKVITASPMHGENLAKLLNIDRRNFYDYLVELEVDRFKNEGLDRDIEYLTVGAMNHWKGTDVVCNKFGKDLTVIGYGDASLISSGANFIGKVAHEEMDHWYNRAKNFVHLPQWKESFSITAAEASLCGCNILLNENVGAQSFNEDLSDPTTYIKSGQKLQEMITNEFGNIKNNS